MTDKYIGVALQDRALEALKAQDVQQLQAVVVEAVPAVIRLESETRLLEYVIAGDHGGKAEHVRALRMRISDLSAKVAHYEQVGQAESRPGLLASFTSLQAKYRAKKAELAKAQQHIDKLNKQIRELKQAAQAQDAEVRDRLQAMLPTLPMLDRGTPNECDAAVEAWGVYEQIAEIIGAALPRPCVNAGRPSQQGCALASGHAGRCTPVRPGQDDGDQTGPVTCGAFLGRDRYCVRSYLHAQDDKGHSARYEDRNR